MEGGDAGTKKKSTESAAKHKGKGQSRRRSCGTFDDDSHGNSKPLTKKRCVSDLSQMCAKTHDGRSTVARHSDAFVYTLVNLHQQNATANPVWLYSVTEV